MVTCRDSRFHWNELSNYLLIHERQVQACVDEGFVVSDGLHAVITRDRQKRSATIALKGRLTCVHDVFLDTEVRLEVMERGDRTWVRLGDGKYHAGIAGDAPRTIFRYETRPIPTPSTRTTITSITSTTRPGKRSARQHGLAGSTGPILARYSKSFRYDGVTPGNS